MDDETYLTIAEVAARLKVTTKTVRQWLQRGQMRGVKTGKLWRIPERAVNTFIQREPSPRSVTGIPRTVESPSKEEKTTDEGFQQTLPLEGGEGFPTHEAYSHLGKDVIDIRPRGSRPRGRVIEVDVPVSYRLIVPEHSGGPPTRKIVPVEPLLLIYWDDSGSQTWLTWEEYQRWTRANRQASSMSDE
jgi:excisionase family DNA binding protein